MKTIVVLYNLKPGVSREDYEAWAREADIPTVSSLGSVASFEVLKAAGLLIGEGKPPYDYVELIKVPDMGPFGADLGQPHVQAGAARFQGFADNPLFILTESI